jgi:hypothetical protein
LQEKKVIDKKIRQAKAKAHLDKKRRFEDAFNNKAEQLKKDEEQQLIKERDAKKKKLQNKQNASKLDVYSGYNDFEGTQQFSQVDVPMDADSFYRPSLDGTMAGFERGMESPGMDKVPDNDQ